MRAFAPAAVLLLLVGFLAGCADPGPAESADPADGDGAGRTARQGFDADTAEMRPVEFHRGTLTVAGQGPETVDVEVPAGVEAVRFAFHDSGAYEFAGLRVELSGCGGTDFGVSSYGGGGSSFSGDLCGPAEAGPQTAAVSGTLVVFSGTFVLTGFVPADNATAADGGSQAYGGAKR